MATKPGPYVPYVMSLQRYRAACRNGDPGYCCACREVNECAGVEPDAERYTCPSCGEAELYGLEQAVILELIELRGG